MRNPNNPKRTIRHAHIMKLAGFKLDMPWMNLVNRNIARSKSKKLARADKLVYWVNDDGIRVTCHDYQQISLQELVRRVAEQARYQERQKARIVYE